MLKSRPHSVVTHGIESRIHTLMRQLLWIEYSVYFERLTNGGETTMPLYQNAAVEETEVIHKPIPVRQFSEYVTQMRRDKNAGFAKQHKVISTTTSVWSSIPIYFNYKNVILKHWHSQNIRKSNERTTVDKWYLDTPAQDSPSWPIGVFAKCFWPSPLKSMLTQRKLVTLVHMNIKHLTFTNRKRERIVTSIAHQITVTSCQFKH